jgi:hypothetical protein
MTHPHGRRRLTPRQPASVPRPISRPTLEPLHRRPHYPAAIPAAPTVRTAP